jgi:hypothetical protein
MDNKTLVITPNLKRKIFELEKEYKIAERYKKAEGKTPQEKLTSMYIEEKYMDEKDKIKEMEFNCKVYSLISGKTLEEIDNIDYQEVITEVAKFR